MATEILFNNCGEYGGQGDEQMDYGYLINLTMNESDNKSDTYSSDENPELSYRPRCDTYSSDENPLVMDLYNGKSDRYFSDENGDVLDFYYNLKSIEMKPDSDRNSTCTVNNDEISDENLDPEEKEQPIKENIIEQQIDTNDSEIFNASVPENDIIIENKDNYIFTLADTTQSIGDLKQNLYIEGSDKWFTVIQDKYLLTEETLISDILNEIPPAKVLIKFELLDTPPRLNMLDIIQPKYYKHLKQTAKSQGKIKNLKRASNKFKKYKDDYKIEYKWQINENFLFIRQVNNFPKKLKQWSKTNVLEWLRWAVIQFDLKYINIEKWNNINGIKLHLLKRNEFETLIKFDPNRIFWIHIHLLQKTDQVYDLLKISRDIDPEDEIIPIEIDNIDDDKTDIPTFIDSTQSRPRLWYFLLQLLQNNDYADIICWTDQNNRIFKIINKDHVAKLWGLCKDKPNMNYENLSRALRYYYKTGLIVKEKRKFSYKFGKPSVKIELDENEFDSINE